MLNMFFNVEETTPTEVFNKIENGENILLLDVREHNEYNEIRIENSILIPRGNLETGNLHNYADEKNTLEGGKESEIIVVCRSGARSLYASNYLKQNGYKNVKSMKSGVMGWAQAGHPVTGTAVGSAPIRTFALS
jgi:rhodanese-related sulfurtransferase